MFPAAQQQSRQFVIIGMWHLDDEDGNTPCCVT